MPKFIGVIEKTETYYVRINAPSKKAAEMWGNDMDYESFTEDYESDSEYVDMVRVVDPEERNKNTVSITKSWAKKRAHITVDEEGEET